MVIKIKKIKPLLPTLKEKRRYLAFKLVSEQKLPDFREVKDQIISQALNFMGKFNYSKAGIQVLEDCYDSGLQRGIVRIDTKHVDEFKSSLLFLTKINNQDVIFQTIGLSGILKKAKERYLAA
jgi:ribonuclease P/MRP protein subunit POP5